MRTIATGRTHRAFVVPIVALLLAACTDVVQPPRVTEPGEPVPSGPLVVTSSTIAIQVPRTAQLRTSGGAAGATSWASDNDAVALVSSEGVVTARFPGRVAITARRGADSAAITLVVMATSIDVEPRTVQIAVGDTASLTARARDADGMEIAGVPITFRTWNEQVAVVDSATGVAQGLTTGMTTITATGGGVESAASVLVGQPDPFSIAFASIGTIGNYACGLEVPTGFAYCWGDGHSGALGIDEAALERGVGAAGTPVPVGDGRQRFSQLSVGGYANCAIESQTRFAYCWGSHPHSAFGNERGSIQWTPTLVDGSRRFDAISTSADVTCGIEAETGLGYCWGAADLLGNGSYESSSTPMPVGNEYEGQRFSALSASPGLVCGVEADSELGYCWGTNDEGQVGDGTRWARYYPTLVGRGLLRFSSISAGGQVACGIEARTGHAYCWGANDYGQLGDGSTTSRTVPTLVGDGSVQFSSIEAGTSMVCAVEAGTGVGYCWGRNRDGSLGDGTTADRSRPSVVGGGTPRFSSISVGGSAGDYGGFEACGVEVTTRRGYCWGYGRLAPRSLSSEAASASPAPRRSARRL